MAINAKSKVIPLVIVDSRKQGALSFLLSPNFFFYLAYLKNCKPKEILHYIVSCNIVNKGKDAQK